MRELRFARNILLLATVTSLQLTGCQAAERPAPIAPIATNDDYDTEGQSVIIRRIGTVRMRQIGQEVNIETPELRTTRHAEAVIAEECDAYAKPRKNVNPLLSRLFVSMPDCIKSEEVKRRLRRES